LGIGNGYAKLSVNPRISFDKIPDNVEDFLKIRDNLADTPQGGATVFVVALTVYSRNQSLGEDFLTIALDTSRLRRVTPGGYDGWEPSPDFITSARLLLTHPWTTRSYIEGTSPLNGYKIPDRNPLSCYFDPLRTQMTDSITANVYIHSSGDNSSRLIVMRKNNRGIWKALNPNGLFIQTRHPVYTADDGI